MGVNKKIEGKLKSLKSLKQFFYEIKVLTDN